MTTRLALLVGTMAFLVASMSTIALDTSAPGESDVLQYLPMAAAAPDRPDREIGSAYTGRYLTHWTVGMVAEVTRASLKTAYALVWALVCALLLVVVHLLLRALAVPLWTYALCAGLFLLNPYAIRQAILETGRVQDLVLVLGVAVALLGLVRVRPALVLLGLVVGLCGRQTALLVAPVAALWVMRGEAWRRLPEARRAIVAVASVAVVAALYLAVNHVTDPFTTPFEPKIPEDTLLDRLDPGSVGDVGAHVLRTFIPLLVPGAVLAALLVVRGARALPWLAVGSALVAAAIVIQPLAIDPEFPGFASNEQRLTGLALLPLAVAAAAAARELRLRREPSAVWWAALGVLLALGSLHHVFTDVGPSGLGQFVVLQFLVAGGLAALVLRTYERAPTAHQAAS